MSVTLNFRTLDLNLLRVFDVVMAERNLTRAAERLSLSQPAVSNALRRLKDAVGDDLVRRAPAGVAPTPRAEALWPDVRRALGQLREVLAPGDFDPQLAACEFRIAMADATAAILMPRLVARDAAPASSIRWRVLPLTSRDPNDLLEQDRAELAIGHFPERLAATQARGLDATLRHAPLFESAYLAVMRRGHPLAEGEFGLDAYCAASHLLVSLSGRPQGPVDQALLGLGRERRIAMTVNQVATAGRIVADSDLIAVLPACFVEATGYGDRLVTRELPFALDRLQVAMLWHLRHDRTVAHGWLRSRLLDAAASRRSPAPIDTARAPATLTGPAAPATSDA